MVFDEKKAAGERLMLACKEMPNADMMLLGTYRGFELNIRFDSFKNEHPAGVHQHLVQLRPYSVHRGGVIRPPAKQSGIEQVFSKTTKQQELGVAVHAPAKSDF